MSKCHRLNFKFFFRHYDILNTNFMFLNKTTLKMKKQILNLFAGIVIGIAFVACKNDSKKAETSDAKIVEVVNAESKYIAIPNQSMTYWKANKIVGGHEGTISLSNGFAYLKNNQLVGGNFHV